LAIPGGRSFAADNSTTKAPYQGDGSSIAALAITPDSGIVITGGLDNCVKLWNLGTGQERTTLRGYPGGIMAMALTVDGSTLAAASSDDFVKLWDVAPGRERRTIKLDFRVWCLAFTPDGQTLIVGGHAPIQVWDVATGRKKATLDAGPAPDGQSMLTPSIAVTADGNTLYAANHDGLIRVWDLSTRRIQSYVRAAPSLASIVLSPDNRTLAGTFYDGSITLWDLAAGKPRARMQPLHARAGSLAFSPDGRTLVSGCFDGNIKFWDVATGRQRGMFRAHNGSSVRSLAFTPDGKTLFTGAGREVQEGEVKYWDVSAYTRPPASK
jgi:WD40 repeat protein